MSTLKKILLAEDDLNDVELILTTLKEQNVVPNQIDVVHDGAEALDYLFRRGAYSSGGPAAPPLLVLLDIKMPKVDGVEVLRKIKADPVLRMIPVVMLTSSKEEKDLLESYQIGANAYVVKPVDFDAFREAMRELGIFWALVNEPPPAAREKGT